MTVLKTLSLIQPWKRLIVLIKIFKLNIIPPKKLPWGVLNLHLDEKSPVSVGESISIEMSASAPGGRDSMFKWEGPPKICPAVKIS